MALIFPNPSRDFKKARNAVGFTGYDGMFEVQFFVEVDALSAENGDPTDPEMREAHWLARVDTLRNSILVAARKAYAKGHQSTYSLTSADLK